MRRGEHIRAEELRQADVIRRGSGELVTVVRICDGLGAKLVTVATARGTLHTWAYVPSCPVMILTR
ncbi:MAG: hypothetical protein ACOYD0_13135 [Candidatus Nanopelagicales bacterium]